MSENRPTSSSPVEAPRMVAVQRRSRRRRTKVTPIDWRRLAVMGVALLCVLMLVVDKTLGSWVKNGVHSVSTLMGGLRLEVVILAVCGLTWFYLTPGVEDRVVRFFKGIVEKRRGVRGGRGRRR